MDQEKWLESVYSDGTKYFVSKPLPELGDTVTICIRMYKEAPVRHVMLRRLHNGGEHVLEMTRIDIRNGLQYFACEIQVNEPYIQYQFYLVTENQIYYYTQNGITTYVPDQTYDFKLLAGYKQPEWVKGAVFYQIFPDRFCNGNPENDVQEGEYSFDGHPVKKIRDWNQPALSYEDGHCLDFYGGDLEGVKQKIPYLKELGVTAIYLNPIFYAATVHKYDCLDYFHVDPHLGGDKALEELTKALHENGMQVILDVSINHTGTANKWFNKDGEFFDKAFGAYNNPDASEREYYFFNPDNSYKAWFDVPTLPTLNYTSRKLRDILYRSEDSLVKKWLKAPYSIDGWRFDVADVMARNDAIQLHREVWPEISASIKETNPEGYVLAEEWMDHPEFLQGDAWDSTMNYYGFGRPVRQFVGQQDWFNTRYPQLQVAPRQMTAAELHARIREHLAKLPSVIQQVQFNLFDSHDISRLHNDPSISFERYRGAVIMLFTMIGAANVYYGDEAGCDGRINDNEGIRYPMPWDSGFEKGAYYELYQKLAQLKQSSDAFCNGGYQVISDENAVFSYARFTDQECWITVVSCDKETREITIPYRALGASRPERLTELFHTPVSYRIENDEIRMTVMPDTSYLIKL